MTGYQPICPEKASALKKCQAFVEQGMENISQGLSLFLQGPVGTGKSHLSVAVLRAIIENNLDRFGVPPSKLGFINDYAYDGFYCSMISVVELLETLRESVGNIKKKEIVRRKLHRIKCDDIVILDDIGAKKPSEFVEEQLFAIIDLRYRTRRSTFFTSNCSLKQL